MYKEQKNHSPIKNTFLNQQTTLINYGSDQDTINSLKDTIISIEYRVKVLEGQVNSKMEREECLTLLQRKSNTASVKKGFDEIYSKIEADRLRDESNIQKIEHEQKQKINDLKKKLKQVSNTRQGTEFGSPLNKDLTSMNFTENISKKLSKALIKPQQLYLESNQTMFSMLIDEIKELKQQDALIQRLIESKHKKTISLNNEVCRKLEHLQSQLEQTVKYIDSIQTKTVNAFQVSSDGRKSTKKIVSKSDKHETMQRHDKNNDKIYCGNHSKNYERNNDKNYDKNINQTESFESIRLQLLSKSIESIQKQLAQKINIKDVIQLIKQNIPNFEESINETKTYVQENFESMRRILQNQSQINQEISKSNRVAWWHCYDKFQFEQSDRSQTQNGLGYILFNQQIMNIIPQSLVVEKDEQYTLKIMTKGWYLIHVYQLDSSQIQTDAQENPHVWIQINNGVKQPLNDKIIMNLSPASQLRLITSKDDLFVQIQKL